MIAEFEADEGLLDQTGRVDFGKASNPPAPAPPVDASGPGDFSRGYTPSAASAPASPAPAEAPLAAAPVGSVPPAWSSRSVEEGPAVKAARAAQLEAARRAMLDDDDEPSDAVEMDLVTGRPVPRPAEYGEQGYGKGVGGASSNPRNYAPARPAPGPLPAVPAPPLPAVPAPPVAWAPPATYAATAAAAQSDAAAQKLWLLQRREWEAAEALLARRAANQPLEPAEMRQLRDSIASIVLALSSL